MTAMVEAEGINRRAPAALIGPGVAHFGVYTGRSLKSQLLSTLAFRPC